MLGSFLLGCDVYDEGLMKSAAPPRRPDPSTEGPDVAPITFAMRDVVLEQQPEDDPDLWKSIGFDLDGFNTTSPNSNEVECVPPGDRPAQVDGFRGIDNNLGARFYPQIKITQELANLEADARAAHTAGRGTFVFHMTGYNGTANDPRVNVLIGQAVGGTPADRADVSYVGNELILTASGDPAPPPAWDGTDHWYLSDSTFLNGQFDDPKIVDPNAYVSNRVMVVHLPVGATIFFSTESATVNVKLNEGVAVGRLSEDLSVGGPITIAGRWYQQDIVDTAQSAGICSQLLNDLLAGALAGMVDVTTAPPSEPGPGIVCDSLSIGVLFLDAVAAADTPVVVNAPDPPFGCIDAGVDGG